MLVRPALRLAARLSGSVLNGPRRFCTQTADIPKMVTLVSDKKDEWAALPAASKAKLLGEMLQIFSTMDHEAWARDALKAEGYDVVQPDVLVGVEMIKNTRLISADIENLIDTIATCAHHHSRPGHWANILMIMNISAQLAAHNSQQARRAMSRISPLQIAGHGGTASRAIAREQRWQVDCKRISASHVRSPRTHSRLASRGVDSGSYIT